MKKGAVGGNGQHAGAAAQVEHMSISAAACQPVDGQEAAVGGGVMGGAKGFAGVDQDGARALRHAVAVMAAVNHVAAGRDGWQGGLRDGDPVEIGYVLQFDVANLGRVAAQKRGQVRAQDLRGRRIVIVGIDAPARGISRHLEQGQGGRWRIDQVLDGASERVGDIARSDLERDEAGGHFGAGSEAVFAGRGRCGRQAPPCAA